MKTILLIAVFWPVMLFQDAESQNLDTTIISKSDSLKKRISVLSTPKGGRVFLDGSFVGETPFSTYTLGYGRHVLRVERDGFVAFHDTVTIRFGSHPIVNIRFQLPGELHVRSTPSGASVFLGDSLVGATPFEVSNIPPGRHKVRLVTPEFQEWNQWVLVPEGSISEIDIPLVSKYSSLRLDVSPPNATVIIDDDSSVVASMLTLRLPSGRHRIAVSHDLANTSLDESFYFGAGTQVHIQANLGRTNVPIQVGSLFVPGLIQALNRNYWEGGMLAVATLASGLLLLSASNDYTSRLNSYNVALNDYNKANTEAKTIQLRDLPAQRYRDVETAYSKRNVFIISTAIFFVYNAYDAIFNHNLKYSSFKTLAEGSEQGHLLSLTVRDGIMNISFPISF